MKTDRTLEITTSTGSRDGQATTITVIRYPDAGAQDALGKNMETFACVLLLVFCAALVLALARLKR